MSDSEDVRLLHLATQLVLGPLSAEPIEIIRRTGRAMARITKAEFRDGSVTGVLANEALKRIKAVGELLAAMTDDDRQAMVHESARKAVR
jgi:hypothetical protein